MKKLVLIGLLTMVCNSALSAQTKAVDGVFWRAAPVESKVAYVLGFWDGMATGNAFTLRSIKKSATEFMNAFDGYNASFGKYFSKVTIGELIASLDAFYQEPRNGNIQVVDAIRVVTNEKAGASRAELDSMIVEYRKPNRP